MIRVKIACAIVMLTVMMICTTVFAEAPIKVVVNGTQIQTPSAPVIVDGRTLVPLRAIFEALGIVPVWNAESRTVTATSKNVELELPIGSKECYVNGKTIPLEVPGLLVNGSTMVPARFIAETFGAEVSWDGFDKAVIIRTLFEKRGIPVGNMGNAATDGQFLYRGDGIGSLIRSGMDVSNPVQFVDGDWGGGYFEGLDMKGSYFSDLNIYDQWVYYVQQKTYEGAANLYRVDKQGKNPELIYNGDVLGAIIVEDRIFVRTGDGVVLRMDLDGKNQMILAKVDAVGMEVTDGWVYIREATVTEGEDTKFSLVKVRNDGTQYQYVARNNGIGSFTVSDGWIYYSLWEKSGIYRMRVDGTGNAKISELFAGDIKISKGWVYFREENTGYVKRMQKDGSQIGLVTGLVTTYVFDIIGDRIFVETHSELVPHLISSDGGQDIRLPELE